MAEKNLTKQENKLTKPLWFDEWVVLKKLDMAAIKGGVDLPPAVESRFMELNLLALDYKPDMTQWDGNPEVLSFMCGLRNGVGSEFKLCDCMGAYDCPIKPKIDLNVTNKKKTISVEEIGRRYPILNDNPY